MLAECDYVQLLLFVTVCVVVYCLTCGGLPRLCGRACLVRYGPFVLAQLLSAYWLGHARPARAAFSLLLVSLLAHQQHYASHTRWYKRGMRALGMSTSHDDVHHSPSGREWKPVVVETLGNVLGISLLWNPPLSVLLLDPWVCAMEGLVYASYHMVNQRLLASPQHEAHHASVLRNLGPDYVDAVLHTKVDEEPEELTTGVANVVLATAVVTGVQRLVMAA